MHRLKKILQSKTMAMSSAEKIPQEIIVDILTRLPAKSVGQFRCVSKQWCSLLSDSQFIKAHLTFHDHKVGEDKLILAFGCHSFLTVAFNQNPQNGNDVITRKLNFQQLWETWTTVGGSCHGLILVGNEEKIQFLINPTTLEYHEIPTFDMALPVLGSVFLYGLGYDVVSDDYKVVTLSYCKYVPCYTFVDVYSVREGIWRRLENSPYNHEVDDLDYGVWLNGALHWLAAKPSDGSPVIVAFDLSVEKFLEVPPPATLDKKDFLLSVFVALRGCLCMSPVRRRNEVDVWMMKDYGVEESWTKFVVKGPETYLIPLCLISEEDVLLDANGELIIYNMREDQWRNRMVDGIHTILVHAIAGTFRESLVSPIFDDEYFQG